MKVGDNLGRIESVLRGTLADADAVIVCGGLGPTHDDLTREAIAAVMGVELRHDEAVAEVITDMFASRGRYMADNNLRQAHGAGRGDVIPQTRGTAPGLICPVTVDGVDKVVYAVPGVPHEMQEMVERAVLPDLRRRAGDTGVIVSRTLRTWGESESGLNERLDPLIARLDDAGNPTLAFLASGWEGLKVRLTAKAATRGRGRSAARRVGGRGSRRRRRPRVRRRRRHDGVGRAGDAARARADAGAGRVGHRWSGGRSPHRRARRQRRASRRRGRRYASEVKFDLLGVPDGPGGQRGRGSGDGDRGRGGCSVPMSGWRSPASPGPPSRTACRWARCASASTTVDDVVTRTFRLPGQREQMRQMSVITALDFLRRHLAAGE